MMKRRITVTIDPAVTRRAKQLAHKKNTSVSGLIEELLRSAPIPGGQEHTSFVARWGGKFGVAGTKPGDVRMKALKAKYRLAKQ